MLLEVHVEGDQNHDLCAYRYEILLYGLFLEPSLDLS